MSAMSSRPVEVGVVLQGGGALGAYECGALIALLELMDDFAAQDHEIFHEWREPLLKIIEVVFPLRKNDGRTLGLKRFQHVIEIGHICGDQLVAGPLGRRPVRLLCGEHHGHQRRVLARPEIADRFRLVRSTLRAEQRGHHTTDDPLGDQLRISHASVVAGTVSSKVLRARGQSSAVTGRL